MSRVEFYKRDELVTDLICCEVTTSHGVHFSHEEAVDWKVLLDALQSLPGFDSDWIAKVSQPPFAECKTCAFERC